MSQAKVPTTNVILWEEELSDADLMAVVGGGLAGDAVGTATSTNSALGNGGRPTSGGIILAGQTLVAAGNYLIGVGNGAESGLQAANGGLAKVGGDV